MLRLPLLFALVCLVSVPLVAHPHVWIDVQSEILVADDKVTGLWTVWDFDPDYSLLILTDNDANGDGRFDPAESAQVRKSYFDNLRRYDYFVHWVQGGKPVPPGVPTEFVASVLPTNQVRFRFLLPASIPLSSSALSLAYFDETIFVDLGFAKGSSVRLTGPGAPRATATLSAPRRGLFANYEPDRVASVLLKK